MEMSQLDFDLPAELIAQEPSPQRDGSRLMVLDRAGEGVQHRQFRDIGALLKRGEITGALGLVSSIACTSILSIT